MVRPPERNYFNSHAFFWLTILSCICLINWSLGQNPKNETAVLFVGNSLTYSNDLPSLVKKIAKSRGYKVRTEMLAFPDYALEDHWNDGSLQKLIATKKFDFVIVQQGPSSQKEGREMLLNYGAKINELCVQQDAKLAFFMVWPSMQYYGTFDGVIANYTEAATTLSALVCPVGKVWKEQMERTKDYSLYSPDGFHPSLAGSRLAAEVIVNSLFNKEK